MPLLHKLLPALFGALWMVYPATADTWNFDAAPLGELPSGWTSAKTGDGPGSIWRTVSADRDGKRNQVLAQTSSDGPDALFNLCVLNDAKHTDVDLSVGLKAISGQNDRGGGLVWRYQDANNYYVTRWNPLEDNFRVYHVVNSKRTLLANAAIALPRDQWHTIRALHRGNHIQCYLDDKLLLDITDDTLKNPGSIGLWTKSDAVTWFDEFSVTASRK